MRSNKAHKITVRFDDRSFDRISKGAERSGVTVSAYIRACAEGRTPKAKPPEELWDILTTMYRAIELLKHIGDGTHPKCTEARQLSDELQTAALKLQAVMTLPERSA